MSYLARCPVLFCMRNTFHLSNLRCYSVQVCEFPVGKLCVVSCVLMVCVCVGKLCVCEFCVNELVCCMCVSECCE